MMDYVIFLKAKISIVNTLEKIVGGDGRFKMLPGNDVPAFSS